MVTYREIQSSSPKRQSDFTVKLKQITNSEIIEYPTCKAEIRLDDKTEMGKKKSMATSRYPRALLVVPHNSSFA